MDKLVNVSVKLTVDELKELRRITAKKAVAAQGEHVVTVSDVIREALSAQFLNERA
jgi:hypothetical protein